jgi:fatty acid desaturase
MQVSRPSDDTCAQQANRHIIQAIRIEEQYWRGRYPILQYQNGLGMGILLLALTVMLVNGYGYYQELIPAWVCIIVAALCASVSHEIEHDLIHRQYFRDQPVIYNLMMLLTWLMRPNTINPWYRRDIHLLHHKTSGSPQDIEERLVGNGITYGFSRLVVMFDGLLGLLLRQAVLRREVNNFSVRKLLKASFPLASLYFLTWYVFLVFHAYDALLGGAYPQWLVLLMEGINFSVVALIAPNFLRSACLNFITSNMHYYGNVHCLMQQTQILDRWFFMPFQLFCCNFGSSHSIHHFVVSQPFYLRQLVANKAHKVMCEQGVRRNDLSTFVSSNRRIS